MTASKIDSTAALSAFTEEDNALLKSLAEGASIFERLETSAEFSIIPEENSIGGALQIAAFLGTFDPLQLIQNPQEGDLKRLLSYCTVSTNGTTSRWLLRAGERANVLAEMLVSSNGLSQGVMNAEHYLKRSREQADDITLALHQILGGKFPNASDFAAMSNDVLAANRAVLAWLQPIDQALGFNADALLRDVEFAELLEPFRFLTGFDPETGGDMFVGREDELRKLRTFVDVLASDGLLESIGRLGKRWASSDRRILCLSGVGGVGKSTLLAKFILQHVGTVGYVSSRFSSPGFGRSEVSQTLESFSLGAADAGDDMPLRFVYLDFDRSTISAAQSSTLILEMLRQLGWQVPDFQHEFEKLRSRIRQEMDRAMREVEMAEVAVGSKLRSSPDRDLFSYEPELPAELITMSLMNSYLHETAQILRNNSSGAVSMLLVLDTFEEAQVLGDHAVSRIESFLGAAQEHVAGLRIVVSGRDEVEGFFRDAERMVITEFDKASRISFLEKRSLTKKAASSTAQLVGGRPLSLLLAARLVRELGLEAVSFSLTDRIRGLFDKALIDGVLYQRILNHIEDKDVRKLAHPGLVLRRIDADLLQSVIAPALGLGVIPIERARRILAAFKLQKDLVRIEPDGSVIHRPDVREQMLALMTLEKPELVRALHEGAAAYYAKRQAEENNNETRDRDRIEEIYHRLSIGDSLDRIPELWFPKARLGLARSVNEIADISGRGTLKVLLGRKLTDEELNVVPGAIMGEYAARSLKDAMADQDPERALALLSKYSQFISPELRRSIEPQALDQSGQWRLAGDIFQNLIKDTKDPVISDALATADFFERYPAHEFNLKLMQLTLDMLKLSSSIEENDSERANRRMKIGYGSPPEIYTERIEENKWSLPITIAALRLKVRQGTFGRVRPSAKELSLENSEFVWPVFDVPSISARWILTLTDEIDRRGLELFESMPVTDTVRGQLSYLMSLLASGVTRSEQETRRIDICDTMQSSSSIGNILQTRWTTSEQLELVPLILRHLIRPPTPQWYVPIACQLRGAISDSIRPSDIYDKALPNLPFTVSKKLHTTKSIADFLSRLDQLGVLHVCLRQLLIRRSMQADTEAGGLFRAYMEWRDVMFFDVDNWFESFEPIRLLLKIRDGTPRQVKR